MSCTTGGVTTRHKIKPRTSTPSARCQSILLAKAALNSQEPHLTAISMSSANQCGTSKAVRCFESSDDAGDHHVTHAFAFLVHYSSITGPISPVPSAGSVSSVCTELSTPPATISLYSSPPQRICDFNTTADSPLHSTGNCFP